MIKILIRAGFLLLISLLTPCTWATSKKCSDSINPSTLQSCMTLDGLMQHLRAFQDHAEANTDLPGTRTVGTAGYDASRDYVISKLKQAGYKVQLQSVPLQISYVLKPRLFEMTLPQAKTYQDDIDYAPLIGSGHGDVTARVQTLDNKNGCSLDDFNNFKPGNIVLLSAARSCSTRVKMKNAVQAGAKAILLYTDTPDIFYMGLTPTPSPTTPILIVSSNVAKDLMSATQENLPTVHIKFATKDKMIYSENIFAESISGDPNHVVMAGAHLDSAAGNAGSNDNGSAAATLLETALIMQKVNTTNKLRFAWWTAEEIGLEGSNYYIQHLSATEQAKIKLYLNYEILGAPNGGRMIMGFASGITPPGSEKITNFYKSYFKSQGLKFYVFDPKIGNAAKRSDMYAFMQVGIPVGYLVTGADLTWNPMLSAIFTDLPKRTNGLATHPCYHRACDKLSWRTGPYQDPNYDFDLYLQMSKAAAYAIYAHAMNLS